MTLPVERHNISIEVVSALHIGTGEKLGRNAFFRQHNAVFIIDPKKLLARVKTSPRLADAYVTAIEREQGIDEFLKENKIRFSDVAAEIPAKQDVGKEILPFIQTADGWPYIPGSTLKGAVRSAFLRYRMLSDDAALKGIQSKMRELLDWRRREIKNSPPNAKAQITKKCREKMNQELRKAFFGGDEHHDVMRCFQFGDCELEDDSDTEIASVKVFSTMRDKRLAPKTIPLNPEIVNTGGKFSGSLSINNYLLTSTAAVLKFPIANQELTLSKLLAACNQVAADDGARESRFFSEYGQIALAKWYQDTLESQRNKLGTNECLLHLAWGSGFGPKTPDDLFPEDVFDNIRWAFNLGKFGTDEQGKRQLVKPFPKSRKIVVSAKNQIPLGWIKVTVH